MNTTGFNEGDLWDYEYFGLRNFEKYNEADHILTLAEGISNTYIWILFAFGVPGNILTIITLLTLQTISPATFFIICLAALDGTSLVTKLIGHQVVRNGIYIGNFGCKMEFLVIYMATIANWMLVLICAERFVTVCHLPRKAAIFKMKNCYAAVAILAGVLFAIFAGIFIPMRLAVYNGLFCSTYSEFRWFWINVWYWINASLYLFIPCLYIIPMTVLMVRKVHISNRTRTGRHKTSQDGKTEATEDPGVTETEVADNEGGFTLMIILAVVFFIVLCLPACVYLLSYRRSNDDLVEARWALFQQVQFLLADSTHAINFFLYFFSVERFRKQVYKVITCSACRKTSYSPDQRIA